ncbi:MAG: hypothetical protein OQK12_00165 [Motiliproteus sp.]|nr:hypothetical protein [Motiliproteus sp.]MCW9050819.1 hypothetical protein [Motiliproteus sp.]
MSKIKNPQENKALSYAKDRRNAYGENDKSSRKNIRKNKRLKARAERSSQGKLKNLSAHSLDDDYALDVEADVNAALKKKRAFGFRKMPDQSLKDHIDQQKRKGRERKGRRADG